MKMDTNMARPENSSLCLGSYSFDDTELSGRLYCLRNLIF